jgi:GT2 family glycosyltransferase
MPAPVTFVVVPTFREKDKVLALLRSFQHVQDLSLRVLIANGNPGDETSAVLREWKDSRVVELSGHPGLFWSGLVNLGLEHAVHPEANQEFVILMNADVEFTYDVISPLVAMARATPNAQLAAVTVSGERVVSSGVRVASWFLTLNRHPLAGSPADSIPQDALIAVDFLPTRCTLIPLAAVRQAGFIAQKDLPHYGADYEYTNRLRKLGYQPFIYTGARVRLDAKNTGNNVFHKRLSLGIRLRSLFSIKSPSNPIYRLRLIRLSYPLYAWPSAMFLYTLRSLVEVLLGGPAIKSLFSSRESGFSGS